MGGRRLWIVVVAAAVLLWWLRRSSSPACPPGSTPCIGAGPPTCCKGTENPAYDPSPDPWAWLDGLPYRWPS